MYGKSVLFSRVASLVNVRYYKKDSTKKLLEFLADMPKANSARILENQRQRQQIAKKSEKYGPSCVYLQVLGSGARGAPNTLYLFTDQKRYLFNCGECTQRLAHEHKVKLSRLDHIFITSKTWKNIGGLPGLSLTLQDVGVPSITLHGPEGLDELYNATKRFVIMKDMNVTMAKCSPSEDFEDSVMSVKYVILGPNDEIFSKDLKPSAKRQKLADPIEKGFEEFIRDDTDYYKPELRNYDGSARRHVKAKTMPSRPAASMDNQDPLRRKTEKVLHDLQKKSHCTVSYICTLKKRLGTLDLAKCVELGVKPGPMLGQLKNGHDVVLPDGTLVLSKDVKTPDDPGPVFIVLDVPNISYLKESEFSAHFANGVNPPENIPSLIVHFSPPEVFHSEPYKGFLALFGPTTRHLILNGQNSCLGSESAHRTQHKLHLLDPDIFPLLKDVSMPAVWNAHPPIPKTNSPIRLKGMEELKNKIALAQFQNIINMEGSGKGEHRPPSEEPAETTELIAGRTLTMFHLRPKRQLDRTAEPKLHIQDYIQETMDVDGFVGSLEQFRRLVDSMRYTKRGSQQEYPKVVFLGTGSCIPSKTRNTSAIVVHVDENRSILLDCGEGTFGQLVRFYGPKKVNSFLRTLRAIYISHLHADHHIGLIGVLQARRQAYDEISHSDPPDPIYLLAPGQIVSWLSLYDLQFERIRNDFTLIPNQNLLVDSSQPDLSPAVLASLGLQQLHTCHVVHCPNAFGVALHTSIYKITYSGDTLPCEALVKLGQDSTLLIHEATMEDELAEEARMKMHSTTTQAIEIGRQMNAQYTVLTHFSQRYARLPRLNANILNDNDSVGIAFDNMQITMSDLDLLPHMYAPLQLMFAEHCVEMELKAAHRACQKLRAEARRSHPDCADSNSRPGSCRGSASSASRGRYKESVSSKLRVESMSKTLRSRSPSQSPNKLNNSSPKTGGSGRSTPKVSPERPRASDINTRVGNANSGRSTPKLRTRSDFCPETPRPHDFGPRSITGSSGRSTPKSKGQSDTPVDPRPRFDCSARLVVNSVRSTPKPRIRNDLTPERIRNLDNSTPCTLSLTSNKSKDTDRSRDSAENNVYIVDTRSKTLNTANRPNSVPAVPQSARRGPHNPHITNSGQVNQRIPPPIRKTETRPIPGRLQSNDKVAFSRSKSPVTRKEDEKNTEWVQLFRQAEHTPTGCSIAATKRPDSGNKTRPTISKCANVKSDKSPVRASAAVKGLKGSASTQNKLNPDGLKQNNTKPVHNNTETKSGDLSSTKIRLNTTKSTTSTNSSTSQKDKKDKNVTNKENRSRANSPKRHTPPKSPQVVKHTVQKPEQNIHDNPDRSKPVKPKRSVTLLKNTIQENAKRTGTDKVRPIPFFGRIGTPNHNNRGFRPQLEDIKSSFLLLNKKQNPANAKQKLPDVMKPKPISEEERRQKLLEIKKTFQSKRFFQDSKYDKIEGLNWITWK